MEISAAPNRLNDKVRPPHPTHTHIRGLPNLKARACRQMFSTASVGCRTGGGEHLLHSGWLMCIRWDETAAFLRKSKAYAMNADAFRQTLRSVPSKRVLRGCQYIPSCAVLGCIINGDMQSCASRRCCFHYSGFVRRKTNLEFKQRWGGKC